MRVPSRATTALVQASAALAWLICVAAYGAGDATAWFQATTQKLLDAVTTGEPAVWDQVLDQDFQVTTEDGDVMGRKQFLDGMRPLPAGFIGHIKVRDLTLRPAGDAAIVHYWLDETEDIFGQELRTTYVETDVYRRVAGAWKMAAAQVTVVPRDLEPIAVSNHDWPALVGEYRYSEQASSRYHVFLRDGALYGGRDPKSATLLIPLAPLVFFQKGSIHLMVFVRDAKGAVTEVRELHKYNEIRMERAD
jgi:hypothetical protein